MLLFMGAGIAQCSVWRQTERPDDQVFDPWQSQKDFSVASVSRSALKLTQPPKQSVKNNERYVRFYVHI